MIEYKKLYYTLFNTITDVSKQLEQLMRLLKQTQTDERLFPLLEQSISDLKRSQIETEDMFLSETDK